jgi:hypothetical protein
MNSVWASTEHEAPLLRNPESMSWNLSLGDKHIYSLLHISFLLGLLYDPEDGGYTFFRKLIFARLRGLISQKIQIFVATSVRT